MNQYMKARWQHRRQEAIEFLGGKCSICDSRSNLEFDHIDPAEKEFTIAKGSSFSNERFWLEIAKCQLLCEIHHKEKTISQQIGKTPGNKIETPVHGTGVMYQRENCRCDECRSWRKRYRHKEVNYHGVVMEPHNGNIMSGRS